MSNSSEYVVKDRCKKSWAVHFSERRKQYYYYNRHSGESFWERPAGISDSDILSPDDLLAAFKKSTERDKCSTENSRIPVTEKNKYSKTKVEEDSGVTDLYNDLASENGSFAYDYNVKEEPVWHGPAPSCENVSLNLKPMELRNSKRRRRRNQRIQKEEKRQTPSTVKQNQNEIESKSMISNNQNKKITGFTQSSSYNRNLMNNANNVRTDCVKSDFNERTKKKKKKKSKAKRQIAACVARNVNNHSNESYTCEKKYNLRSEMSRLVNNVLPVKEIGNTVTESLGSSEQGSYSNANHNPSLAALSPLASYSDDDLEICTSKIIDDQHYQQIKTTKVLLPAFPSPPQAKTDSLEYEEMDWEVSLPQCEILRDIGEVRKELASSASEIDMDIVEMEISVDECATSTCDNAFLVVDTNVFIGNLDLIKKLAEFTLPDGRSIIIVVPWQVMQELDKLKTKPGVLGKKSRSAVNYIFNFFVSKNPRLVGQSAKQHSMRENYIMCEVPDDAIICCCLQLAAQRQEVALCSNDKNLVSKASANGISALTVELLCNQLGLTTGNTSINKSDVYKETVSSNIPCGTVNNSSDVYKESVSSNIHCDNVSPILSERKQDSTSLEKMPILTGRIQDFTSVETVSIHNVSNNRAPSGRMNEIDVKSIPGSSSLFEDMRSTTARQFSLDEGQNKDLMMEFQTFTTKFLCSVLVESFKKEYGSTWMKRPVKKPPWKINDLYLCVKHHWFLITGKFLPDELKNIFDRLRTFFKKDVLRYTDTQLHDIINLSLKMCFELSKHYYSDVDTYKNALLCLQSCIPKDYKGVVPSSGVTFTTIDETWKSVILFCGNLSAALGLKEACKEYRFKVSSEQPTCSLGILKERLPAMNSFLNLFVSSAGRVLKEDPESLTITNPSIEKVFLCLNGFLDVSDPEFSVEHILDFFKNNRQKFEEMVSEFDRLKYHLARCTKIIQEQS
ncbi:swt1 RNA endoribonuclease isoform X2 [Lycorma delicatula]|uniref:swt1 RNA endoribonuclease isoform X2 n=1 Tax=Lycorma delicatula TaxID=130591 RepID=UPI003F5164EB